MKVAVTGHTSGIGKALFDEFTSRGHDVIGFSKSNGYDIADVGVQDNIVDQINDVDIFVNNAHERFFQVELFTKVWRNWRALPKKIINIGSIVTTFRFGPDSPQHPLGRAHYASEKVGLEMASNWAWNDQEARCDVMLVKPGLVDTPRTKNDRIGASKIDPSELSRYIVESILNQQFVVREITIGNHRKNNA